MADLTSGFQLPDLFDPLAQTSGQSDPQATALRARDQALRERTLQVEVEQEALREQRFRDQLALEAQAQKNTRISTFGRLAASLDPRSAAFKAYKGALIEELGGDPSKIRVPDEDFQGRLQSTITAINQCSKDYSEGKISGNQCEIETGILVDSLLTEVGAMDMTMEQSEHLLEPLTRSRDQLDKSLQEARKTRHAGLREAKKQSEIQRTNQREAEIRQGERAGRDALAQLDSIGFDSEHDPALEDMGGSEKLEFLRRREQPKIRAIIDQGLTPVFSKPFVLNDAGERSPNPQFITDYTKLLEEVKNFGLDTEESLAKVLEALEATGTIKIQRDREGKIVGTPTGPAMGVIMDGFVDMFVRGFDTVPTQ